MSVIFIVVRDCTPRCPADTGPLTRDRRGTNAEPVKTFRDQDGIEIRLTEERLAHILEHPEMRGLEGAIEETVREPIAVVKSVADSEARLYYRLYTGTIAGDKFLCVVVRTGGNDAFVLTAYLTDRIKRGLRIWTEAR